MQYYFMSIPVFDSCSYGFTGHIASEDAALDERRNSDTTFVSY
ncbi:hypothetical protein OOU_Y34scaffold00037g8 [Pyricularia oryzae Y34]|uniref:Uncharacterized protein n=2 Tax=Pyricularia oryzae TaxID=318829 RepID=A0AA97PRY1_PYRO3|nr:hypothetical protein OOU_Y34scaffold00037g8 [Pyricularia oryzae Y34]